MIDHQKAQRWIHARVDGALPEKDVLPLEQHLQECSECRRYAHQIERLDRHLLQAFAERRLSEHQQAHTLPVVILPPHAGSPATPMRAPMNRNNMLGGLFRTATYIAALAGLTGGLIFLFSSLFRPPTPGAQPTVSQAAAYPAGTEAYPYPAILPAEPYPGTGEAYPYPAANPAYPFPHGDGVYPYPSASHSPYPAAESRPAAYPGAGAYPAGQPTAMPPTQTRVPGVLPDLDNLPPYTKTSPLMDVEETVRLLQALRERNLAWLRQPGWHVMITTRGAEQQDQGYNFLLLVQQDQKQCEQVVYYTAPGKLTAVEIRLSDGAWATKPVEAAEFTMGNRNGRPCSLETFESLAHLNNAIDTLLATQTPAFERQVRVWVEQADRQIMLAVERDETYTTDAPTLINPDTLLLDPLQRQVEILYFDLQTGNLLGGENTSVLMNGKVIPNPDMRPVMRQYQLLDSLPPELAAFYQDTLQALQAYLSRPSP